MSHIEALDIIFYHVYEVWAVQEYGRHILFYFAFELSVFLDPFRVVKRDEGVFQDFVYLGVGVHCDIEPRIFSLARVPEGI